MSMKSLPVDLFCENGEALNISVFFFSKAGFAWLGLVLVV